MKISTIVLHFGYVESGRCAPMMYSSKFSGKYFKDPKLAFETLAIQLFNKFLKDRERYYENAKHNKQHRNCPPTTEPYCSKCGILLKPNLISDDEFESYLLELQSSTANSYGSAEEVEIDGEYVVSTWYPFNTHDSLVDIQKGHFIIVWEKAETYILTKAKEKYPELFEDNEVDSYLDWDEIYKYVGKIKPPI